MKKSIKWLALVSLLLIVVMSFALVSCGGGNDDTDTNTDTNTDAGVTSYTITFKQADGTEDKVTVKAGETVNVPTVKQVDGYSVAWETTDFSNVTADMTVNAVKTAIEYTITYEVDGGENANNPTKYTIETATIALANPTKVGNKFLGWYSDAELTTKVEQIATGSKGNVTLYAGWELVQYEITYEVGAGTNDIANPTKYTLSGSDIILKPAAAPSGYDFEGWYLEAGYQTKVEKIEAGKTGKITLYARYEFERFDIVYELNGGKNNKNNPADFNKNEAVAFQSPSKAGYEFKGWFTDIDCTEGKEITSIPKGTETPVTVYAKWAPIVYNIEYVLGDIATNNAENPSTYTVADVYDLKAPTFVVEGYTFDGWYTDSDYTGEISRIENSIANLKLYAKYTPIEYAITYEGNEGEVPAENPILYTVENVGENKLVLADATRKGYTFKGWYLDKDFTGEAVTEVPAKTIGGISLFAKWEIITYNITYVLNDGTNAEANKSTFTVESNVTFADATKEGTYLIGWYRDEACTEQIKSTHGITTNITVYAKWFDKLKDPSMKFDKNVIESITTNEENPRKDKVNNLFDGVASSGGIYDNGDGSWYGNTNDVLTITFKEEIDITKINLKGCGNWSYAKWSLFNEAGDLVAEYNACLTAAYSVQDVLIYSSGDGAPAAVKTIRVEIGAQKWDVGTTNKFLEIEIEVANPDYNPEA
ncbi:MAG: InlB B-repeat-containing protein [Clostridia bacterium]|nr:InlB B-repeat-containing protein [Clostridia bacterium]